MSYLLGSATEGSPGRIGRFRASNRAMSQAEMSAQFMAGPAARDMATNGLSASNVAPVAPNFALGAEGYTAVNATLETNQTVGGESGWAKLTFTTTGVTVGIRRIGFYQWTAYENYNLEIKFFVPSANVGLNGGIHHSTSTSSNANSLRLSNNGVIYGSGLSGDFFSTSVNMNITTKDKVLTLSGPVRSRSTNADDWRVDVSGTEVIAGDVMYIKMKAVRAGVTADLAPSSIQLSPGQWLEQNGNHIHIPDGFRLMNPETSGDLRFNNSWNNDNTLQYGNNANTNVFAPNTYIEEVIIIPTASSASGFELGNGVDQDYYGVVNGPVVANVPIHVGLNTQIPDSNRRFTIKPIANYSGAIKTTTFCRMLEV